MSDIYRNIKRKYFYDEEDSTGLLTFQWGFAYDTNRLIVMNHLNERVFFYDSEFVKDKLYNLSDGAILFGRSDDWIGNDNPLFMYDRATNAMSIGASIGTSGTTNGVNRLGQIFLNKQQAINTGIQIIVGEDGLDNGNGILVSGNGTQAPDDGFWFYAAESQYGSFCVRFWGHDDFDYGKIFVGINHTDPQYELHVVGYGAFSETIMVGRDPEVPYEVATKNYIDNKIELIEVLSVKSFKASVKAATTENITLEDQQTIDGVFCGQGDRVLVKNQTDATQNRIWQVNDIGAWYAPDDPELSQGTYVFVNQGDVNANTGWIINTADPIILDTTEITWVQILTGSSGSISGSGVAGYIPKFTDDTNLTTSSLRQADAGEILSDSGMRIMFENLLVFGYNESYPSYFPASIKWVDADGALRIEADSNDIDLACGSAGVVTISIFDTHPSDAVRFRPGSLGSEGYMDGTTGGMGIFNIGSGGTSTEIQFNTFQIQAMNNGTPSALQLNPFGGDVSFLDDVRATFGTDLDAVIFLDSADSTFRINADNFQNLELAAGSSSVINISYTGIGKIAQFRPDNYGVNGNINGTTLDEGLFNVGSFYGTIQLQFSGDEIQAVNNTTPSILKLNQYGGIVSAPAFAAQGSASHSMTTSDSFSIANVSILQIDADNTGYTLTLSDPTHGQHLTVYNSGSNSITIGGTTPSVLLAAGKTAMLHYSNAYPSFLTTWLSVFN